MQTRRVSRSASSASASAPALRRCNVAAAVRSSPMLPLLPQQRRHRPSTSISASASSASPVALPVDYSQLLGLHGRDYLDAQIISAYEELASAPPPTGFSRRALDGRSLLLQEALQQLRAARGAAARAGAPRDALPGPPAGLALDAPLLPGALALLQEVGECEIVLSAGANALRNGIPVASSSSASSSSSSIPLPPSAERDVRLAMAHAHCALAGATLEKGAGGTSSSSPASSPDDGSSAPPSSVPATAAPISVACAHLAEAAALLAGAPAAPASSSSATSSGGAPSPPPSPFPPLAPKLAADVARGLADLAPGCALEQLDLPLDQGHAPVRAAAVAVVAHALRAAAPGKKSGAEGRGGGGSSPSSAVSAKPATPEFARAALSRMGASEVASALDWSKLVDGGDPSPYAHWLFPGAVGAAGAAHVVAGFLGRKPALVDLGEKLLAAEADAPAAAAASGGSPLAPRVAALVLLGEPEAAATLLTTSAHALEQQAAAASAGGSRGGRSNSGSGSSSGLSSAAARARAAAADLEFVAAASRAVAGGGEPLDALPGLVALTEEWLARGGFPAFRDTAERPPSPRLSAYFDDGKVAAALDARAASKEKQEAAAREQQGKKSLVVSAVVGAAKGVASAASLVASAIPLPAPAPPSLILPRVPGARAAASAAAASRGGRGLVSSLVGSPPSTLAKFVGGAALLSAVAAAAFLPSRSFGVGAGGVGGITARQQQQHAQTQQQRQPSRRSVFSGLLQQEQQQRSSASTSALPSAPVRSAGATSTSSSTSTSEKKAVEARPSPLARFSTSLANARAAAPPTQRQAEAAIGAWHSAKAAALGPRHDTSRLSLTTAEPWRSAVEKDSAASRSSGWFWTFKLRGLRVEKVEAKGGKSGGGGGGVSAAVAHARVREAGDLYARTGKRSDGHSYDNAYSAEYTLVRSGDESEGGGAQWKVAGVLVTGEPRSRSA